VHTAALPNAVRRITSPLAGIPLRQIPTELLKLDPEVVLHMIAMGEEDAEAATEAFAGVARRLVVLSSGDVYRAYGIFIGIEVGPITPTPLGEDAPLRSRMYPYRSPGGAPDSLESYYEKILVERTVSSNPSLPATILRLPKVYGPDDNHDLRTVYGYSYQPQWRWTHGYVENVAQAISLAVCNDIAAGRTYNVGEAVAMAVGDRLRLLPPIDAVPQLPGSGKNFHQDIAYDTSRIRAELDFVEEHDELLAMQALAAEHGQSM
jgi:nucleoside-diphosphate-sugar epimerase